MSIKQAYKRGTDRHTPPIPISSLIGGEVKALKSFLQHGLEAHPQGVIASSPQDLIQAKVQLSRQDIIHTFCCST